jgi:hypothetical protein
VVREGQTKKFPVVVVELRGVTPRQALSGPLSTALALDPSGSRAVAAIEAAPRPDYLALAEGALTSDDVRDIWMQAQDAKHVHFKGADDLSKQLMAIAERKDQEAADARKAARTPEPDEDGAVDAEIVEDAEPTGGWPVVAKAGSAN